MKDLWRILYSAKVQAVRLWVEISNLNKIERMSIEYSYHRYACKFFFYTFSLFGQIVTFLSSHKVGRHIPRNASCVSLLKYWRKESTTVTSIKIKWDVNKKRGEGGGGKKALMIKKLHTSNVDKINLNSTKFLTFFTSFFHTGSTLYRFLSELHTFSSWLYFYEKIQSKWRLENLSL